MTTSTEPIVDSTGPAADSGPALGRPPPRLGRRSRWLWIGLVLAIIWAGLVAWSLRQAAHQARGGVAAIEAVQADFRLDDLESGRLQTALHEASARFESAQGHIRAPWVTPLRIVPLAGQQIRSADALSSSAAATADALLTGAESVLSLKDGTESGLIGRAEAARQSSAVASRAVETLETLELGPASPLVPPLRTARADFASQVADLLEVLKRGELAAEGIAELLTGPSYYLLISSNTAEMRAGTGMFLLAGVIDIEDGELSVGTLQPTGPLRLETPVAIPDADFKDNWGWMQPDQEWRNLATSPRLAPSAEMAAAMWKAGTSDEVDGVLVVDPVALEALLHASGPIQVGNTEISASNIVKLVAFDQYWETDAEVRRERMAAVAAGAFAAVSDPSVDLFILAAGLADAAAGRHLMAWSSDPSQQAAWEALEIAGSLTPDSVMISVLNRGANKLDTFLDVSTVATSTASDEMILVELDVSLTNRTSPGLPDYVLGPAQALDVAPGTYVGMLTINVPGAARDVSFRDVDSLVVDGVDGPTLVQGVWVELPAGESTTYHLSFSLPADAARLVVEPSARVPGIDWNFDGSAWVDRGRRTIDLATGDYGAAPSAGIFASIDTVRSSQVAVPPTPRVELSRAETTTAVVNWRVLLDSAGVVLWERESPNDWAIIYTGSADDSFVRRQLEPATTVCYRTALAAAPTAFGEEVCVGVPAPVPPAGYLEFEGDSESYLTAPDFIGGSELDVRLLVAPEDWTPDAWTMFVGQFDRAVNDRSWRFGLDAFESFRGNFSADGVEPVGENQPIPDLFVDGIPEWIRMTIDTTSGIERFWISDDGETWNQWGDDVLYEPFELHDSAGPVYLGSDRPGSDNAFSGKLFYLEIAVNGEVVSRLDLRREVETDGDSFVDDAGVVWTGRGSGWSYVSAAEAAAS